ncbi:MAG: CopG family transcriptional regulator, partial [Candidatus Margulisbacteria bacterium]|nr:CopG family transcriptional regulator [Candidatus Margulisiibacteriota bacterium]
MTIRSTFTIDEENSAFLIKHSEGNKSAYINQLITIERIKTMEELVLKANQEEAADLEYQKEL